GTPLSFTSRISFSFKVTMSSILRLMPKFCVALPFVRRLSFATCARALDTSLSPAFSSFAGSSKL
ncbi:MAG: hypothetical protein L0956_09260, partial [Candidatus Mariimomonas ferrooxydans]